MRAGERQSAGGHLQAAFGRTSAPYPLRTHQHRALDQIDRLMINGGRRRAWVVLPPGAGKTLVGLEAIRRLGRPAVVFGPNTAIQAQWVRQWEAFSPATVHVGVDRSLDSPITALTYQSLATFDADEEVDEEGHGSVEPSSDCGALLDRLHPNGRALFDELRTMERLTVVLDECHHLLEVWGRLVADLLASVPHAYVLGLTATPARSLTKDQAELVDDLFGHPIYATSIPSVVREGHIAPFAELAWLTTPTPTESRWLSAQAERFQELTTDLVDPAFGSVPFLTWLDERFVARSPAVSWHRVQRAEPELTDAALRLHHIGLLRLPDGVRLREEHRQQPTADDWVVLIDDWLRGRLFRSMDPRDQYVLAELRRTLPSVGFSLTKRGIRPGRSPVDRVLARSAAKMQAGVEIVAAEHGNLDDRLRMLILCDHERATATLPATLRGVLAAEAGSARLMLESLVGDARTRDLGPMLVTGKTVAGHADVAEVFAAYVTDRDPSVRVAISPPNADGVVEITGRWTPRTWLPAVTSFFESGGCRVLVGTRGLLGEGWDARGVSGLVDLTTATTPTSVVQTRGRALRLDPSWPEKVAVTWTVVCATEDHPKGHTDWDRFVRKHEGYFGIDETGEIVDGVAHVDPAFSPFAAPEAAEFDAVNAGMLVRAESRGLIRQLWRVGTPYIDRLVHTLRVRPHRRRAPSPSAELEPRPVAPPPFVVGPYGVVRSDGQRVRPGRIIPVALVVGLGLLLLISGVPTGWAIATAATALLGWWLATAWAAGAEAVDAATEIDPVRIAFAVADGMHGAGLTPVGSAAVNVRVDEEGEYRIALTGVDSQLSGEFAAALDEALSAMGSPRYVVPRYVMNLPVGVRSRLRAGTQLLVGRLRPQAVIWHAVPTVLGVNARRARAYAGAWRRWISAGEPLYTGSPEGEGVLATHRGADPMDATTALRVSWN